MGLAGPKKRNKIGTDPNNTTWAKSTDRFGHKILTAQGWKPGNTLGQENASHASHYTAASSSHIRVLLREENLGIGAKNGRQDADTFGLDMFQGLLGRLNGKSEDVLAKEEAYRRDLRLKERVVKNFGGITFVSAGYLVGDEIKKDLVIAPESQAGSGRSKKRKHEEVQIAQVAETSPTKKVRFAKDLVQVLLIEKRGKKSKKTRESQEEEVEEIDLEEQTEQEDVLELAAGSEMPSSTITPASSEKEKRRLLKAQRRAEKAARKQARAQRRLKRQEQKSQEREDAVDSSDSATSRPESSDSTSVTAPTTSSAPAIASVPRASTAVPRGRFLVRSRYHQQKRMAVSDEKALREIFMIKADA